MPLDPQLLPEQSERLSNLMVSLVTLGSAAGGCLAAVAIVFFYYLALPDSAKSGDAGFGVLGDFLHDLMTYGLVGTVTGAALGLWLLAISKNKSS